MGYYVQGGDGRKYGPADEATLRVWMGEGRVLPDTWLEEEGSGRRVLAKDLLGQAQSQPQSPYASPGAFSQPPGPASPYPRQSYATSNGQTEVVIGWVCAVISLGCCPPGFGAAAIILGFNAKKKGHPGGQTLIIAAVIMMVVGIVVGVMLGLGNGLFRQ